MDASAFDTVFLDLDGTVTDSAPGILNAVEYALGKFGRTGYSRAELNSFVGPPLIESFQRFIPCSHAEAERCLVWYREYFTAKGIYENSVYAGIREMLERLRQAGKRVVLATAKPELFARKILDYFGLTGYFDAIHGATMDERRNHKADVIAWALTHSGEVGRVLMVGDRENDISGAKANGLESAGALWGYGGVGELTAAGADFLVETPAGIMV